ncbi:speckle-type POZ protein B-like [Planococcus citri]|uniref:speckle-type POZ protein B-like n=1 Tax=Planococcus citri TaxID=170843 RepID=UPI0031F879B8
MQNPDTSPSLTTVCHTEVNFRKLNYMWVIHNYRRVHDERDVIMLSSAFSAHGDEFEWRLRLNPNCSEYISLHLCPDDASNLEKYVPISCNLELSLMNSKNEKTSTQSKEFVICGSGDGDFGFDYFVERDGHLFVEANELLPNDQLTVLCQLSYYKNTDIVNSVDQSFVRSRAEESQPACLGGIETLFMDNKFSDITICVKNQEYPAHKNILAARCPYFRKMFNADWKEKNLDSIELKLIDETVFEEVLRYIYSGSLEKVKTMATQLLEAADMFDLEELKLVCEEELLTNLSTKTAVDLLVLADRYNAKNLKAQTINYVKMNSYNPDMLSAEIQNELVTSNPRLLLEIMNALAKVSLKKI